MKKLVLTAFAAMAMVAMVACNNNKAAEATEAEADANTAATEQCEKKCAHEGDSASCCQAKVEGAASECAAAEGKECCKKAEGEKCCKAEGKECPKAAEQSK